jgi:hypothetical protein
VHWPLLALNAKGHKAGFRGGIQLFVGEHLGAPSGVDGGTLCRCVADGGDEGRDAVGRETAES